jgi:hypothetical protein
VDILLVNLKRKLMTKDAYSAFCEDIKARNADVKAKTLPHGPHGIDLVSCEVKYDPSTDFREVNGRRDYEPMPEDARRCQEILDKIKEYGLDVK